MLFERWTQPYTEAHTVFFGRHGVKLMEMPRKPPGIRESSTACSDWTSVAFSLRLHGRGKMLFSKMAGESIRPVEHLAT
jgi:hypothetical protein